MTHASQRRHTLRFRSLLVGALLATGLPVASAQAEPARLIIETRSNRADLVSGGDVLVEVRASDRAPLDTLAVHVNGEPSGAVTLRPDGRYLGVLTGLPLGESLVTATATGFDPVGLRVTNHPIGGPVFSGEQVQPWACTTERNGLGAPQDAQCNAAPVIRWRYRTTGGAFRDYNLANPPTDVANTLTDQGETVPYVFKVEIGAMNRGIYRYAILADPTQPSVPWIRPRGWNGGVYYKFGAACGTVFSQGDPIENVEDNRPLSKGYAVATSSLSVLGSNCNTVTSAESLMMLQEHLTERYGEITHTRGKGGSGGSIGQTVTASGYPGLLQGLNVDLSFEDVWTTLTEVADCRLLLHYFTQVSPHLWADARAQGLVAGHASMSSCAAWEVTFAPLLDPGRGCGAGEAYHATTKPDGCRSTIQDMQVSILGRRPQEVWTPAEHAAGRGFAEMPYDNTGRLYGLQALRSGDITPEQFLDLNEKIGGLNIDGQPSGERNAARPEVVETLYRAGLVASGETLGDVAILDVRAFSGNAEIHTNMHSYAMRQRLVNANGHHANQSIWQLFEVPNLPSVAGPLAFGLMSDWLHAIDRDDVAGTRAAKVARNRPPGAEDACLIQDQKSADLSRCAAFTYFGTPLTASGGPRSNDVMKCTLRPLPVIWPADGSFGKVPFTPSVGPVAGQWDRLRAAFPDGVCDFAKPGVGQVPVQPWTGFSAGPGGAPIGPAPVSFPV